MSAYSFSIWGFATKMTIIGINQTKLSIQEDNKNIGCIINDSMIHTMALIPPEDTNAALASLDCRTAPSKSEGKQLKNIYHIQ